MIVEKIVYVIGRGNIICSTLGDNDIIHMNDNIKIKNYIFDIIGTEIMAYSKKIGLILRPNDLIKELVNIGDEIKIIKKD